MLKIKIIGYIVLALLHTTQVAIAKEVILTVEGNIHLANADKTISFSLEDLKKLPTLTIKTETSWSKGMQTFVGVSLSGLLKHVGAEGTQLVATALNEYSAKIPVSDAFKYPIILAYQQNSKPLTVRTKGPLWIIYPQTDYPAIDSPMMKNRWVWQLKHLSVE